MTAENARHTVVDVQVDGRAQLPGADRYARDKVTRLLRLAPEPVLFARVRLSEHRNPAVSRPVTAQANLDVNGRLVRAQVAGATAWEAIDRLDDRLRQRLKRIAQHWQSRRGQRPSTAPHEWRHGSEPSHRPRYFPRPEHERRIIRRKAFTIHRSTLDEAATDLDLMDYDFWLFTETGTGKDSVLYHAGATGYRIAQTDPSTSDELAPHHVPVTISPHPAPELAPSDATTRLTLTALPFVFFLNTERGRGSVLYHRYDGHYGLITPADP
ncbi:HPF/RaiA family ribosome-associated protein [Haloechinothrix sp. LS1_15]|uniref:ribosome hibernation promotion factor n=1 Tax=Haloechinothrix sp. LS1_15 TaxID=2652248 RepID=UPI0029471CF2|nr:HPF/RaiA family ribosome-associated protein [Haloechinothrix sp. LS1_15]MDV6014636.1 HPF/RaiA family ribosome-associated protein [Haloechinothrix sp. LS1_15]